MKTTFSHHLYVSRGWVKTFQYHIRSHPPVTRNGSFFRVAKPYHALDTLKKIYLHCMVETAASLRLLRPVLLCGLFICAIAAVLSNDGVKNTILVRIFDNSPDPDEPTEQEENARQERRQDYYSVGTGPIPISQDTER